MARIEMDCNNYEETFPQDVQDIRVTKSGV